MITIYLFFSDQGKSKKQLKKEEKLAAKAMKKEQFKATNVSLKFIKLFTIKYLSYYFSFGIKYWLFIKVVMTLFVI
jgi:hypothetical protein